MHPSSRWLRFLVAVLLTVCAGSLPLIASAADEMPSVVVGEIESIDHGISGRVIKVGGARFLLPSGVPVLGMGGAATENSALRPGVRVQLEVRRDSKIVVVELVRLVAD